MRALRTNMVYGWGMKVLGRCAIPDKQNGKYRTVESQYDSKHAKKIKKKRKPKALERNVIK